MYSMSQARRAAAYRQVEVESRVRAASPHQLVALLYEELLSSIQGARNALMRGNHAAKGEAISRAIRVIEEGLKAGLDLAAGGALARNLMNLYDSVAVRLTLANARNDDRLLLEAASLIEPVRDAWNDISPLARPAQPRIH